VLDSSPGNPLDEPEGISCYQQQGLVLDLRYAPESADRVREMVRKEQQCCAFLTFEMHEEPDEIRLKITAPEEARETAALLFEQFVAFAPTRPALGCCGSEGTCGQ
jgi:hypothetical protein